MTSVLRVSKVADCAGTEVSGERLMVVVKGNVVTPGTVTTGVMTTSESEDNWFVTGRRVLNVTVVTPASVTAAATIMLDDVATTLGPGTAVLDVNVGTPGMIAIVAIGTKESAVCGTPVEAAGTVDSMVNAVTPETVVIVLEARRLDIGVCILPVKGEKEGTSA